MAKKIRRLKTVIIALRGSGIWSAPRRQRCRGIGDITSDRTFASSQCRSAGSHAKFQISKENGDCSPSFLQKEKRGRLCHSASPNRSPRRQDGTSWKVRTHNRFPVLHRIPPQDEGFLHKSCTLPDGP